ncbi:hypothetical protein PXNS11_40030 [Stutzerimonas xanthomarina]|nr:hypothetical protein PXNS11_40030 [Stutzerimonas xanthomarina]
MIIFDLMRVQGNHALALLGQALQFAVELRLAQLVTLQARLLQLFAQGLSLVVALAVGVGGRASQRADGGSADQQGNRPMSQRHASPP